MNKISSISIRSILVLFVLVLAAWTVVKETPDIDLNCLLQTCCHWSTIEKLSLLRVFGDLGRNQLRQWFEEGCRKPVLGVCPWRCHSCALWSPVIKQNSLTDGSLPSLNSQGNNLPQRAAEPATSTNSHKTKQHQTEVRLLFSLAHCHQAKPTRTVW